jgi:hypothetical protein
MKQLIAMLFICVLFVGCTNYTEPERTVHPKFQQGDIVELRLGSQGQIVHVLQWGDYIRYEVRVLGQTGPVLVEMREFELHTTD